MKKKNNTTEYDILFLHPPSSFNKTRDPLSGNFSSGTGTSDLFLYAPIGVMALYHRLKSQGFHPGFLNFGRLLKKTIELKKKFDPIQIIENSPAKGFGIDLHWAVHTPGALDLAAAIKRVFPNRFVFLGGLTATYFFQEILKEYPYIDAVVLGEADEAIVPLAETLQRNSSNPHLGKVPNLAYRRRDGAISVNPVKIPEKWENVSFRNVEEELSRAYISIKGCSLDCPFCGGSKFSYQNFFYRDRPLALEPKQLIQEIEAFEEDNVDTVFLMGDIRIMGEGYVNHFFKELNKSKFNINILQELFFPADLEYLEKWKKATTTCSLVLSLESEDDRVLRRIGHKYSHEALWDTIKNCSRLELPLVLFLLCGLPEQNAGSIRSTMDFIEQAVAYQHIDFEIDFMFYIDPGSPIFENPKEWGYSIEFRTLKDFKKNLEKPHWSQSIGYHSQWLSKEEFIDIIFHVAERSSRIRLMKSPDYAPLHLLNIENMEANRKIIKHLQSHESVSANDNYIRNMIKKTFPPYLLKDNLLQKTKLSKTVNIPYTTFPYLSYLLLQAFNISPHRLMTYFKKWFEYPSTLPYEISLETFRKVEGASDSIKKEILNIIKDINVDPVFIENLMDFEWINELASRVNTGKKDKENKQANNLNIGDYSKYKLILNESVVLKTFKFNFDRIDWVDFSNREPLIPGTTYYLYSLQKGNGKAISPFIRELLNLCDGRRHITEIIKELKKLDQEKEIAIAMNLGALVSEGILLPQL